jgi:hypothetical protein
MYAARNLLFPSHVSAYESYDAALFSFTFFVAV